MDITIYRVPDGRYILVPEVFLPSSECLHRFGTLTHCGEIKLAEGQCSSTANQVVADIERDSYAMLEAAAARVFLGPGHRCLAAESDDGDSKRNSEVSSFARFARLDAPAWD